MGPSIHVSQNGYNWKMTGGRERNGVKCGTLVTQMGGVQCHLGPFGVPV